MFDACGNANEWCYDLSPEIEEAADVEVSEPIVDSELSRVIASYIRAIGWYHPARRHNRMGFRLALSLEAE